MKKKIMIIFSALIIGSTCAYYLFNKVVPQETEEMTIKAFQIGAYTSIDNAYKVAERTNGIVITEPDLYRVYIAILSDNEAITKLSKYYNSIGLTYYIRDISVPTTFKDTLSLREEMLKESTEDSYSTINLEILKKYKEYL